MVRSVKFKTDLIVWGGGHTRKELRTGSPSHGRRKEPSPWREGFLGVKRNGLGQGEESRATDADP